MPEEKSDEAVQHEAARIEHLAVVEQGDEALARLAVGVRVVGQRVVGEPGKLALGEVREGLGHLDALGIGLGQDARLDTATTRTPSRCPTGSGTSRG